MTAQVLARMPPVHLLTEERHRIEERKREATTVAVIKMQDVTLHELNISRLKKFINPTPSILMKDYIINIDMHKMLVVNYLFAMSIKLEPCNNYLVNYIKWYVSKSNRAHENAKKYSCRF